jgi:hypothetical protein
LLPACSYVALRPRRIFTPLNVYPACPVGLLDRTGVECVAYSTWEPSYLTGAACPVGGDHRTGACPVALEDGTRACPEECEAYSSGVGGKHRTGVTPVGHRRVIQPSQ